MRNTTLFFFVLVYAIVGDAQIKHGLRVDQGRHVISRGFVVNTNDHKGKSFLARTTTLGW